ncbi:MAG: hypothetical protein RL189_1158 [Pseudomonadota bacterium]|jgi:hypothetical protein
MKIFVLGMLGLSSSLLSCKNREFNGSKEMGITGPALGRQEWKFLRDNFPEMDVLRDREVSTFARLNPGYELWSQGLFERSIDGGNNFRWKLIRTRLVITYDVNRLVDDPIATTEYSTLEKLVSCDLPVIPTQSEVDKKAENCRGIFVKGVLVGATGCEFDASPNGLCVDRDIGKRLCTAKGADGRSTKFRVVGCSIPSLNEKNFPTGVVIFK